MPPPWHPKHFFHGWLLAMSTPFLLTGGPWVALGAWFALATPSASGPCWSVCGPLHAVPGSAWFGADFALDGERLVVGAPGDKSTGQRPGSVASYVAQPNESWLLEQVVRDPWASGQHFGGALALEGNTLIAAATFLDDPVLHEFRLGPNGWSPVAARTLPGWIQCLWGSTGELSLRGDTLAVGLPGVAGRSWCEGLALVLERNLGGPSAWGVAATLASSGESLGHMGISLDLSDDGQTLAVGEPGAARVSLFGRDVGGPSKWGLVQSIEREPPHSVYVDSREGFGRGVDLDGRWLAVGWPEKGEACLFAREASGLWVEWATVTRPGQVPFDAGFGADVQLDGDRLAVAIGTGGAAVYELDALGQWRRRFLAPPATKPNWLELTHGPKIGLHGRSLIAATQESVELWSDNTSAHSVRYCTTATTGTGCRPALATCGRASATAPAGFLLTAYDSDYLDGTGLFYLGTSGRQAAPWRGSGFQCVTPPLSRGPLLTATAGKQPCSTRLAEDLNARWCPACPRAAQNPGAGTTVQAQLVQFDVDLAGERVPVFSNAVEFEVGP